MSGFDIEPYSMKLPINGFNKSLSLESYLIFLTDRFHA